MSFLIDSDHRSETCFAFCPDLLENLVVFVLAADDRVYLAHVAEIGELFFCKLFIERHHDADSAGDGKVRLCPLVAVGAYDAYVRALEAKAKERCSEPSDVVSYSAVCELCEMTVSRHYLVIEHLVAESLDSCLHHHLEICDRSADAVHHLGHFALGDGINV